MDGKSERTQTVGYMADTKRAAAHRRPGPEHGVAAYRRTPEREQTTLIGWPSDIGGRQHDNIVILIINTQTIFEFQDRLVAGSDSAFFLALQQQSCSSQEIQPSTWLRIASLHLAETLRPAALPHGSALHL